MKTTLMAATAMLCIGAGAAYADNAEDAGWVPNTYFTELPGVISTAPGMPPNDVASNANQSAAQATTWVVPQANTPSNGS
jgi:hypothetical protein